MVKLYSPYVIAVLYPRGAAGKFIINSIGLSNNAIFQHNTLCKKQLNNEFTPKDKLEYLLNEINKSHNKKWDDLGLGCKQLFLVDQFDVNRNSPKTIDMINTVLDDNKYICIVGHDSHEEFKILSRWKNANIIKITHHEIFGNLKVHEFMIDKYNAPHFEWDARWFLTQENTITHLRELYNHLGLQDFNEDYIIQYYNAWMKEAKCRKRL